MATAMDFYPPHARDEMNASLRARRSRPVRRSISRSISRPRRANRAASACWASCEIDDGTTVALVGVFQDVTERHALEVTLRRTADTDSLTGIANRAAFDRALDAAMTRAHADGTPLLLALVDLDGFKAINDTLGHTAGDDVLRGVGREPAGAVAQGQLRRAARRRRVRADRSTIPAWPRTRGQSVARLEEALRFPIALNGLAMVSAGTVGIAALDRDCHSIRDFVHRADTILYQAKRARVGERRRPNATRRTGGIGRRDVSGSRGVDLSPYTDTMSSRARVLVLNAALGPLDYRVPAGMSVEPGSIVVAPLGPRQLLGVVWEAERMPSDAEVGDNRLRNLLARLPTCRRSPRRCAG